MRAIKKLRPISIILVALQVISIFSFSSPQAVQAQRLNNLPVSAQNVKSVNNAPFGLIDLNLTTSVTSTVNPAIYSQPVTFRGTTVFGVQLITPTGYMDFYDGTTFLSRVPISTTSQSTLLGLLYTGFADYTTNALSAGTHTITAIYRNSDLLSLTLLAQPLTEVVNKASATISLASSPNPASLGQSTSLTATVAPVAPATAIPTGSVTFRDGATVIGTANLDGTGKAVLNVSNLGGGSHSLTASYNGDTNFNGAGPSSPAVSQSVNKGTTTSSLTAAPSPGSVGSAVTFTATIGTSVPGSFSKAGTVTFKDGGTTIGTVQASDNGVAVFSTSALTAGSHSITAEYAGNANFNSSTSSAFPLTINIPSGSSTTTTPGGTLPGGINYGQPVTLTVHVGATVGGTPTGTVTYYDNGTAIGTVPLDGSGNASFSTSDLSAGNHTLTATYSGDSTYAPSTTTYSPNPFVIGQASTTVGVTGPATAPVYGQSATFSVAITDTAAGGIAPSGTVTFTDGATVLGTANVINGSASFTTGSLGVGSHSISATYGGDTNFSASPASTPLNITVGKSNSLATVNASNTNPAFGQPVIFMVQVAATGSGSGTPTGTVTFKEGSTVLSTQTLANGAANFSTSSLGAGTHLITATYSGDGNFNGVDSSTFTITVDKASTLVSLSSSDTSAASNSSVTFTATVTNVGASGFVPTGSVTFKDGDATLGTSNLVNGTATYTVLPNTLSVGTHTITAVYSGTADFSGATSTGLSQVTNSPVAAATTSSAGSIASSYTYGSAIPLSVTVTSASGTPTGTVTYFDNGTAIGTVDLSNGSAALNVDNLGAGSHTLTAKYNGNGAFAASTTNFGTVTIDKANTGVTVDSPTGPNPDFGQPITVTVHVSDTAAGGNPPGGTVTVKDGGTTIGTAAIGSDGTATFSTSSLGAGAHNITVEYGGDSNFNGATSGGTSLTIDKADTSVAFTTSAASATVGDNISFKATVTNTSVASVVPTGTVTFKDGATVLGTVTLDANGEATYNTSSLGTGSHSITAVYNGTGNFNAFTSTPINQVITPAGGAVSTSTPGTVTGPFNYGQPVTLTVTVGGTNGGPAPTGTVTFYDNNGVPIGTAQVDGTGKATLVTTGLTAGDHTLSATYGGDSNYASSQTNWPVLHIDRAVTNTSLTSSDTSTNENEPVIFTATVSNTGAASIVPTGTVTFKDGTNAIATIDLVNGVATLSYSGLTMGTHTIMAVYNGTSNFQPSDTSTGITQVISGTANDCTTVSSSADTNTCGTLRGNINDALTKLASQDVTITVGVSSIDLTAPLPDLANNDGTHTLTLVGNFSIVNNRCVPGTSLVKSGSFSGAPLVLGNKIIVKGFRIDGFAGNGVEVTGSNNVLTCMYIGLTTANTGDGVNITGGHNILGSATDATLGNVISGNTGAGIHVVSGTANEAYGNWVGLDTNGTTAKKNGTKGLKVDAGGQLKLGPGNRIRN